MKLFNKYKFSDKSQTLGGTISVVLGFISLVSLFYGIYISFMEEGHAGLKVGSLGLISMLMAFIGTIIGLLSFKEDNKFYTLSKVGSLMCGIQTIFMISVFMMGI